MVEHALDHFVVFGRRESSSVRKLSADAKHTTNVHQALGKASKKAESGSGHGSSWSEILRVRRKRWNFRMGRRKKCSRPARVARYKTASVACITGVVQSVARSFRPLKNKLNRTTMRSKSVDHVCSDNIVVVIVIFSSKSSQNRFLSVCM